MFWRRQFSNSLFLWVLKLTWKKWLFDCDSLRPATGTVDLRATISTNLDAERPSVTRRGQYSKQLVMGCRTNHAHAHIQRHLQEMLYKSSGERGDCRELTSFEGPLSDARATSTASTAAELVQWEKTSMMRRTERWPLSPVKIELTRYKGSLLRKDEVWNHGRHKKDEHRFGDGARWRHGTG